MPRGKSTTTGGSSKSGGGSGTTTGTNPLLNNTVVNTLVDTVEDVKTKVTDTYEQVEEKVSTGVDKVKGVVDKYTYSHGKDETIHSKGGTVKGFEEAEGMVTKPSQEDAEDRFTELQDLLFRKAKNGPVLRQGTLDLFNKITPRLAGGGVLKDWGHRQMNGMNLTTALRRCFKGYNLYTGEYLVSMLKNDGIPSVALQVLDAMGHVSVKQRLDEKAYDSVIKGICKGITPTEAKQAKLDLKAKGIADDEIPSQITSTAKLGGGTAQKIKTGDVIAINKWVTGWDEKLARAVAGRHQANKRDFGDLIGGNKPLNEKKKIANIVNEVRKQLGKIIAGELEYQLVGQVREELKANHPLFEDALGKIKYIDTELKGRLIAAVTTKDKHKLIYDPGKTPSPYETSEQKDVREREEFKEKGKNLASVSVARALMGLGGLQPEEIKSKGGLGKFVDKMDPEARKMLVASYLTSKRDRQKYLNPSTKISETNALFEEAWEKSGLRQDIEDALFNQEKLDKIEKSKKEKDTQEEKDQIPHLKAKVVRIHSMLRFGGDAGPNYMALVDLAKDAILTKVSTTTYGTRIWEISQRIKGAEIYQIRNDLPLLMRLRKLVKKDLTRPSITNWDKFIVMLKLPDELKLREKSEEAPTLENVEIENNDWQHKKLDDDETTLSQAYQSVSDDIEFTPLYWVMHLHRHVKMISPSLSDTYSIVTRAQIAAKRWVKLEQQRKDDEYKEECEEAENNGDDTPDPPAPATEQEFMEKIFTAMSKEDQKSLKKKIPHAYEALANGKHLTTQVRLDRAKGWTIGGSQTSLNTNKQGVVSAFEDLSGRELMDEWSNFDELKQMHVERLELVVKMEKLDPDDEDDKEQIVELETSLQGVGDRMARWWPSINRERLKYIEENLSGGTRTEVLGMLATKLAGAMRGDSEFIEAAREAGLTGDDYDAERLMFGHMMNKRRQLDTGLQYGSSSQMKALKGIRTTLSNPMSFVSFVKNEGSEDINKSTSQARKAQSNIYLAQVRNTQSQLEEVRNDTSLTTDQRTEKSKHIREVGSEQIEQSREEMESRTKLFSKARKALTAAISKILQVLMVAAVTAATFGQGTVAVIVSMILAGIAREAGKALVQWAMQGDAFEHKELAKAIAIGAVKGALRAATMELLSVLDMASTVVDFSPEAMGHFAETSAYGEIVKNAVIEGAMRSAIVDIPMNTMKYFLNTERPFRDFGRNLDVFIATNTVSVLGRQVNAIIGSISGQNSTEVSKLFGTSGPPPPGSVVDEAMFTFKETSQAQVAGLVGRTAMIGKKAKIAMKLAAKKLWGKYPEAWKKLANESVGTIGKQLEEEGVSAVQLPKQTEQERVFALLDEIAEGTKGVEDLTDEDKKSIGLIIAYLKTEKEELP